MASSVKPLGPLIRCVEVYFVVALLTVIGYGLIMAADDFKYDITLVRVLVVMAVAGVSLWLIELRSRYTRPFVVVSMGVVIALSVVDIFIGGDYPAIIARLSPTPVLLGGILYFSSSLFIMGYFAFGRRPREVFVADFDGEETTREIEDDGFDERPFSWPWWRNLIIYFCTFSILGHWAEIAFCWLIVLGVFHGDYDFSHAMLWEQWLFPYSAEGIAVVLIVVLLYPVKQWLLRRFHGRVLPALIVSFLLNALVCTTVDFMTGIIANQDYSLWDYRDLPFNFMGQVCLQNSMVYSIAATLIVWVIYPMMARVLHRAPKHVVDGIFFGLIALYAFLAALYFIPGLS